MFFDTPPKVMTFPNFLSSALFPLCVLVLISRLVLWIRVSSFSRSQVSWVCLIFPALDQLPAWEGTAVCWHLTHYLWSPLFLQAVLVSILTCFNVITIFCFFDREAVSLPFLCPTTWQIKLCHCFMSVLSPSHQNSESPRITIIASCLEYCNCFLTFLSAYILFLLRCILIVSGKLIFLKHCPDDCHSRL